MSDDPQVQLDAIPWYKSPQQIMHVTTAVSALLALSPKAAAAIGAFLGIDLSTPANVQVAVEALFGFIAIVAPSVGAWLRARSKVQPLTISQKKADAVNAPAADSPPPPVNK
jgi:hypothetical protein